MELKPNKEDIKIFVAQMFETSGWKIFNKWLEERLEIYKDQTIEKLDLESKGRVQMIREIYEQLKDYSNGR